MSKRHFYIPVERWKEPWTLEDGEAKHAVRVLRCREGQEIVCFNGRGLSGVFRISGISRMSVFLDPVSFARRPAPASGLALAVGWSKNLRRGWLLEKAAELGAWEIVFWQGMRSQGRMPHEIKEAWNRHVLAGAKQSGSMFVPKLRLAAGGAQSLTDMIAGFNACYVLWEDQKDAAPLLRAGEFSGRTAMVIIGPEGGLDSSEAETFLDAGCLPRSLGPLVLRWETAALVSLVLARWGALEAD
jgi:16S rRNA (uracil1498-N3)-methyltransferase